MRSLEREGREYEAELAALRTAIDGGDVSGVAEGDPFERVREALELPEKAALTGYYLRVSLLPGTGTLGQKPF